MVMVCGVGSRHASGEDKEITRYNLFKKLTLAGEAPVGGRIKITTKHQLAGVAPCHTKTAILGEDR